MPKEKKNKGHKARNNMGTKMDQADKLFSILVRLKDMLPNGYVSCYTCTALLPFRQMQCGHFVPRGHKATRWLEENARPQCWDCNINLAGNTQVFEQRLEEEHPGIVQRINNLRNDPKFRLKESDLEDIIAALKERIKQCGGEKSIPKE